MKITSAKFVKGVVGEDEILHDGKPQVAFLGRSNVGKSSVINSLVNHKGLAKSSSYPGRTKEINFFLVNNRMYLVDLPGYGYAKGSMEQQGAIQQLIYWYLHDESFKPTCAVLIVDAKVGFTKDDLDMLHSLHEQQLKVIVVANKIDKLNRTEQQRQLKALEAEAQFYQVLPYSAEKKIGVVELWKMIMV